MMDAAACEGRDLPPSSDKPQTPSGQSSSQQAASVEKAQSTPTLHASAQSTAKDSTPSSSSKDTRATVRVNLNLLVSTPTGSKLAVNNRGESPAGGEPKEPKCLDQEKEIALTQLQELEEAIKVRKVTKVDGRKIRWIEYRERKRAELEQTHKPQKKGRKSKGSEDSENDSSIVNNNNNIKSESNMKVEVVSPPLSVVGKSNVLETMKQQFLQGTENASEPLSNGKADSQNESPEGNQKRKSNRTRKSLGNQKNQTPKTSTPKGNNKNSTLKEANGKGANRRNTPKGGVAKASAKAGAKTPGTPTGATPVTVTPASTPGTPAVPVSPDQSFTPTLKKSYFPSRSLTKGLREVRKTENGESPKKEELSPVSVSPLSIPSMADQEAKADKSSPCPLVSAAARLLSPPGSRSRSVEATRGRKARTGGKKGKAAERAGSEPRKIMNGHTDAQNGTEEEAGEVDVKEEKPVIDDLEVTPNAANNTQEEAAVDPSEKETDPAPTEKTNEATENTVEEESLVDEAATQVVKKTRGRPPKRKPGTPKTPNVATQEKSNKKQTVVVDVHSSMNGEPVIPVTKPVQRGKKSPVKKAPAKTLLSGGKEEDTKDEETQEEPVADSKQEEKDETAGKEDTEMEVEEEEKNADSSASVSNQIRQTPSNAKSTKNSKVVQKATVEVPSDNPPEPMDDSPSLTHSTGNQAEEAPTQADTESADATPSVTRGKPITKKTPVAPAKTPVAPAKTPVAPAKTPVAPAKTPVAPAKTPVAPAKTPAAPAKTPVAPASKTGAKKSESPSKKDRASEEETSSEAKQTSEETTAEKSNSESEKNEEENDVKVLEEVIELDKETEGTNKTSEEKEPEKSDEVVEVSKSKDKGESVEATDVGVERDVEIPKKQLTLEEKQANILKENNNLPEKETLDIQILSTAIKDTKSTEAEEEESEVKVISEEQTVEKNLTMEVSPSTTSVSPEAAASGAKSKEKVPRILKQLFLDEGVQNMLKSMGEESGNVPEGTPDASIHKLRPKRGEPMLSSSPELDALEALLSPTTKKKRIRSELDSLYMDEGVLNLLTSLEPNSRRSHQDDASSDISQASSVKSGKANKITKSYLDAQSESRKRKLSGASTVSNTSTRSMQPPDSKKARLDGQELIEDPYELDTAEEFKEQPEQSTVDDDAAAQARKRGRPTLPLSVKQKNKAIKIQLKLQKQKQLKDAASPTAGLHKDDNMNVAPQIEDVLQKARDAFNAPMVNIPGGSTVEKAVPPLKIKLASDSVTIRPVPRPSQAPQSTSATTTSTNTVNIRPVVRTAASDAASTSRAANKSSQDARPAASAAQDRPRSYSLDRRTPPPQPRRVDNITSPTAESFISLVRTLEASGHQKSQRQRPSGESVRQSQRASVRQSEGNYHFRDISLRKFNNFTQIILSPSTTKMKNALNSRVLREMCEALQLLRRDDSVRMVLVTATGSTFCQGVDLTALQHHNPDTRKKNAENLIRGIKDFLKVLVQFPKPIVAGVNGSAMGLGVTMLPLFDLVIANDKADFYLPYAKLGQVPEGGATYTFPNLFGKLKSTQLFLGHKVTAAKATEMGLASESLWPATYQQELIPKVALLAQQSAQSMEATKALMNHHLVTKLELSLESECRLLLQQWTSPHFTHMCKRFLESHPVQLQKPVNLPHQ